MSKITEQLKSFSTGSYTRSAPDSAFSKGLAEIRASGDMGIARRKREIAEIPRPEYAGDESASERRYKAAEYSAKRLEAEGKYLQARQLMKEVQDEKKAGEGFFSPFWRGVGDVISGTGQAADYIGTKFDMPSFRSTGEKMKSFGGGMQELYTDEEVDRKLGEFDYKDFYKPEFYHQNLMRGAPFMLATLPASVAAVYGGAAAGTAAAGGVATKLALGTFGRSVLTSVGKATGRVAASTVFSRPIESSIEAGQTYSEMLAKTGDKDAAIMAADQVFKNNMKLAAGDTLETLLAFTPASKIPFIKSLGKMKGIAGKATTIGAKMAATGAMEGTEELLQSKFSTEAMGEEFSLKDPATQQAGVVGALMGGLTAGGGEVFVSFQEKVKNRMTEKAKADFEEAKQAKLREGMEEQLANLAAMEETAEKNKGVIKTAVDKEVMESAGKDVEVAEKKAIKYNKNSFDTMEGIDKFLEKNSDKLSGDQIESLFELQNKIYERDSKKVGREQMKLIDTSHEIFRTGEAESQYQEFRKLVKNVSSNKLSTADDAGIKGMVKDTTALDNTSYSADLDNNEMLDIFKERLIGERTKTVSKETTDINARNAEIKLIGESLKKDFDATVVKEPKHPVRKKGVKVFRGGEGRIDLSKIDEKGVSVTEKKDIAELFTPPDGGVVDEAFISADAKILKDDKIPSDLKNEYLKIAKKLEKEALSLSEDELSKLRKDVIKKQDEIVKYAKDNNYDVIEFVFEDELRVINKDALIVEVEPKSKKKVEPTKGTGVEKVEPTKGTGKVKKSKFAQRIKKLMPDFVKGFKDIDPTYTAVVGRTDRTRTVAFVEKNYEDAIRVFKGELPTPDGMRTITLFMVTAEMAEMKGDVATQQAIINRMSEIGTKLGQEIEAFKHLPKDSAAWFIKEAASARMKKVGKIKISKDGKIKIKEGMEELTKSKTKELETKINKKVAETMDAQKIINSLIC